MRPSLYWTCGHQAFLRSTATLLLIDFTKFMQVFRSIILLYVVCKTSHLCVPRHGQATKVARMAAPLSPRVFAFCFPSQNGKNIRCQGRNETYNMSMLCIMLVPRVYATASNEKKLGNICSWRMKPKGYKVRSVAVTVQVAEFRDKGSSLTANWINRIAVTRYMYLRQKEGGKEKVSTSNHEKHIWSIQKLFWTPLMWKF